MHGLGSAAWPRDGIEVAVRCVSHLSYVTGVGHISVPPDIRLVIEEGDMIGDICKAIDREINRTGHEDGVRIISGKLFTRARVERPDLELWVMPQYPAPRKLFRYTGGQLTQSLSTSIKVRSKDKRLFMEAHFMKR